MGSVWLQSTIKDVSNGSFSVAKDFTFDLKCEGFSEVMKSSFTAVSVFSEEAYELEA